MAEYRVRSTPGPSTIEDLERLPDDGYRYELVRGWLVREPLPGANHGEISARLVAEIAGHVMARRLGRVFSNDSGFVLSEDPQTVRGPDVAFVAEGRLPPGPAPRSYLRFAPDLAVEVVSPSNRWSDVAAKVRDFLDAGARLVWVVDPPRSTVTVHRAGATPQVLADDAFLDGEDVLPGFRLQVGEIFSR